MESAGFLPVLLLPHRTAPHIFQEFPSSRAKGQRMARVTVEDCVVKVPNRFELVLLAAQRAREVTSGAPLTLDRDDDKNPVVALRVIAEDEIDEEAVEDELAEDMLAIEDEEEIGIEPGEEPVAEEDVAEEEIGD